MHSETATSIDPAKVAERFLKPTRRSSNGKNKLAGERVWVDGPVGRIAVTRMGQGPAVMLVHGWEGRPADLAAFVPGLVAAGYEVIAPDLPAHGESEGETASIPLCAEALLAVQQSVGSLRGVIAHSIGCPMTVEAADQGMDVQKLVLIAAPARYVDYASTFAARAGLDREQTESMIDTLKSWGVDVRSLSLPKTARRLTQRALFIHSTDDRVVSIADGREGALAWNGAQMVEVNGLGHVRILQDPAVVGAAVEFIAHGYNKS
jgi:pimeloyl-ACP methyl ester carboxylesterase